MRMHLFEFSSEKKKLKCLCGWERTMKSADIKAAYTKFDVHCAEQRQAQA